MKTKQRLDQLARRACTVAIVVFGLSTTVCPAFADSAELHNTTGLAFYYQGKDAEAFAEFVKALEKDPSFAQPRFNLGRLFERQKRNEEAFRQYRDALQLDPSLVGAKEGLERMKSALAVQGRPTEAPSLPTGGLSPEALQAQLASIRALVDKNELTTARERLDVLSKSNPSEAEVLLLQADLAEKSMDYPGAIDILNRALVLLPGTAQISYRLALNLYRIGHFDKAEAQVERAMQINPNKAEYYHLLGRIQGDRGKPAEAYNALNEAARLNPDDKVAKDEADRLANKLGLYYYNAGLYYFQQQSWTKAKDLLKRAIEKGNLNPEQMAVAQQYLVISEFSSAKVAEQIKAIQSEREFVENGSTARKIQVQDAEGRPASYPAGSYVDFLGWIVARKDGADSSDLIVTKNYREVEVREQRIRNGEEGDGGFRSNSRMAEWYTIRTPRVLPSDPRIAPSSRVRVKGKLGSSQYIRNPYNFLYSQIAQPTVDADYLEIYREPRRSYGRSEYDSGGRQRTPQGESAFGSTEPRPVVNTPPGLAGPLKIDFLRYNEEQLKNLERAGEF